MSAQDTASLRDGFVKKCPDLGLKSAAVEIDGKGRIFISDIKGIQVFSNDGRYLDVIKVQYFAYGLTFDDQGKLYVTTNQKKIEKYKLSE